MSLTIDLRPGVRYTIEGITFVVADQQPLNSDGKPVSRRAFWTSYRLSDDNMLKPLLRGGHSQSDIPCISSIVSPLSRDDMVDLIDSSVDEETRILLIEEIDNNLKRASRRPISLVLPHLSEE